MKFLRFLISRSFFINLLIAIAILVVAFMAVRYSIVNYTRHGETLTVPDLSMMTVSEVEEVCKKNGLDFIIEDSAYEANVPLFVVLEQKPEPGMKVKPGRTVEIVLSTDNPPLVQIPSELVNQSSSLDIALELVRDRGFQIDSLEYIPHEWQNMVLAVKKDGRKIEEGTYLKKGSKLVLVVGDGLSSEKVEVPYLIGNDFETAIFILSSYGLNFGGPIPDSSVTDTFKAIIYNQKPLPKPEYKVAKGTAIDVYLTTKEAYDKMEIHHERYLYRDSTNIEMNE